MSDSFQRLKDWIADMALLIGKNKDPEPRHFLSFLHEPELTEKVIDLIEGMEEEDTDENQFYYSACVFALDICVAQLQAALESGNKAGTRLMQHLMAYLSSVMQNSRHGLNFWLPVLNAFYDVHVELSPELRDTYMELAGREDDSFSYSEADHLEAIRAMIEELSHLSVFDIADNFFAQSHAMPVEFFSDLVVDLYSIEEGQDIGVLALLHPKSEVRETVLSTFDHIMDKITLTPVSLSRLQRIKNWYPESCHEQFNRWIRIQRKKGVTFFREEVTGTVSLTATEVDGSGAQGIFIHYRKGRKHRLCGLLLKREVGIKDAWLTPWISAADIKQYHQEAFDDAITLLTIDIDYLTQLIEHFLSVSIENDHIPGLHFLEMQELTGLHFLPKPLEISSMIQDLAVKIQPFTPETVQASFKRSKSWLKNKSFTESWYIENAHIDRLVNRCSSFVEGIRVCDIEGAAALVMEEEMERCRERWLFHFLWVSLWLKGGPAAYKKLWQDSFIIAYAMSQNTPLKDIPVLKEISRQSVINSIETMSERRTHLNQEQG